MEPNGVGHGWPPRNQTDRNGDAVRVSLQKHLKNAIGALRPAEAAGPPPVRGFGSLDRDMH